MPPIREILRLIMSVTGAIMIIGCIILIWKSRFNLTGNGANSTSYFEWRSLKIKTAVPEVALFVIGLFLLFLPINFGDVSSVNSIKIIGHLEADEPIVIDINCPLRKEVYYAGEIDDVFQPFLGKYHIALYAAGYVPEYMTFPRDKIKDCINLGTIKLKRVKKRPEPNPQNIDPLPKGSEPPPLNLLEIPGRGARQ